MLFLNGNHLAPVIRLKESFRLNDYSIREYEVRFIPSFNYIIKAKCFILKGNSALVQAGSYTSLKLAAIFRSRFRLHWMYQL